MKVKYNEDIISRGELYLSNDKRHSINKIKDLILSHRFKNLYGNYKEEAIVIRLAFENYIIKNNDTKDVELKQAIDYIKEKIVEGYRKNPFKYTGCTLLKDEYIEYLYDEKQKEKLKEIKLKYLDYINKILQTKPYNQEEMHRLMQYFNIVTNRDIDQEKYFKEIIKNEKLPKDEEHQRFLYNYIKVKYNFVNPEIYVCKFNEKNASSYQFNNYIFINTNETRLNFQIKNLCHELRYLQHKYNLENGSNSIESYEYTIHELFQRYYNLNYFKNNKYSKLEKEATINGYKAAKIILDNYGKNNLIEELTKQEKKEKHKFEFIYTKNERGLIEPFENYTVKKLNMIIRRNPKELKTYPILLKLYNKDGTPKTLEEILSKNDFESINNNGELYYFHIVYYVKNTNLNKIENLTKIKKINTIKNLEYILNMLNRKINKMAYTEKMNKEYEQIYTNIYIYYIKIAAKIIDYLCANLNYLNDKDSEYSIISRITNLVNIIDNEIEIIENIELKNKLSKLREVIKKSEYTCYLNENRESTKDHMNNLLTKEEKKKKITYNGKKYTLEDFIINVVPTTFDNTNFDLTVHMNGIAINLDDYIVKLKDKSKEINKTSRLPTFSDIKSIAKRYDFKSKEPSDDNPYGIKIIDNKTNEEIEDNLLREKAVIADIWRMAAGTTRYKGEKKPGITIAFEPENRNRYNYILKLFQKEIKENSRLDIIKLCRKAEEQADQITANIIYELLIHPGSALMIEEYFKKIVNYLR